MKKRSIASIITVAVIMLVSILSVPKANAQGYGEVSFDLFYNELSPYGFWENDPQYGDIWFPNVSSGFRPYNTNGYWAMTEYGNTWVSNYAWGWAPFHYGRWVYTSYRGWGWMPGYEWGPAWVEWRSGNGYYGWAPMMPRVGVHIAVGLPINLWIFAPTRRIFARDIYRYSHVGRTNIYNRTTIINNTYIVNNRTYYGGPSRRDMERTIGRRIQVHNVRQSARPGASRVDRTSVSIYRPDRDANRTATRRVEGRTSETRGNDRATSSRSSQNNTRSTDNRQSTGVSRTTGTIRPAASNRTTEGTAPRREMHIDNNGKATIRESNRRTREVKNTNRNTTGPAEKPANRQAEQKPREQVQKRNDQRETRVQNNRSERSNSGSSAPKAQRQEGNQQRTQPTTRQRTTTQQVHQTRANSSSSAVTRQSTPRVERSTPARQSSSAGTTSSRSGRSNERSGTGRR